MVMAAMVTAAAAAILPMDTMQTAMEALIRQAHPLLAPRPLPLPPLHLQLLPHTFPAALKPRAPSKRSLGNQSSFVHASFTLCVCLLLCSPNS